MKEKVWLHIPNKSKVYLQNWDKYYAYQYGEYDAYALLTNNRDYKALISKLHENGISYIVFRREYSFSKNEKENAEILRLIINGEAKDSEYVAGETLRCECCGHKLPQNNSGKLYVDYCNIKKHDISVTYIGYREIIVSERLRRLIEKFSVLNAEFRDIYQINKPDERITGYYHLCLDYGFGNVIEPTIVEKGTKCDCCGYYDKFLRLSPLTFRHSEWSSLDMCFTKDWFGQPPYKQSHAVIITQNMYRAMLESNIKGISVEPAFLVE